MDKSNEIDSANVLSSLIKNAFDYSIYKQGNYIPSNLSPETVITYTCKKRVPETLPALWHLL